MTPRQKCMHLIEQAGADWQEYDGWGGGLRGDAWTPPGIVWRATGTHGVVIHYPGSRPEAWRELLVDLRAGTEPCDIPECETCAEAETA